MMKAVIQDIPSRQLIGTRIHTSLAANETVRLWSSFMPQVPMVMHRANNNLYSVQVFKEMLSFEEFTPHTVFETWAAVEVTETSKIPEGMNTIEVGGLYAFFIYKGLHANFNPFLQKIYQEWMPASEYELDQRPHFEVMKPGYRPDDPEAEEEIWIPVRLKS